AAVRHSGLAPTAAVKADQNRTGPSFVVAASAAARPAVRAVLPCPFRPYTDSDLEPSAATSAGRCNGRTPSGLAVRPCPAACATEHAQNPASALAGAPEQRVQRWAG